MCQSAIWHFLDIRRTLTQYITAVGGKGIIVHATILLLRHRHRGNNNNTTATATLSTSKNVWVCTKYTYFTSLPKDYCQIENYTILILLRFQKRYMDYGELVQKIIFFHSSFTSVSVEARRYKFIIKWLLLSRSAAHIRCTSTISR